MKNTFIEKNQPAEWVDIFANFQRELRKHITPNDVQQASWDNDEYFENHKQK